MRITKTRLKEIIKEELNKLQEFGDDSVVQDLDLNKLRDDIRSLMKVVSAAQQARYQEISNGADLGQQGSADLLMKISGQLEDIHGSMVGLSESGEG